MGKPDPSQDPRVAKIAHFVREARGQQGLSRSQLARKAGVAEGTIKNVEGGRHLVSTSCLEPLSKALGLRLSDLLSYGEVQTAPPPTSLNCRLYPSADPIHLGRTFRAILGGSGGQIDQQYLYIDALAAEAWAQIAEQPAYAVVRDLMPLPQVARQVAELRPQRPLTVVGLGCGDGAGEIRLTRILRSMMPAVDLQLVDISLPLLAHAHAHAVAALGDGVEAHNGSFHDLPRSPHLLPKEGEGPRRRLLCMLGNTFANLENELLFVKNTLSGYRAGDLLLLDITRVRAPADRPAEIRAADARLCRPLSQREREHLVGPILRYGRAAAEEVELAAELDLSCCPVPGSYGVRQVATVGGKRFGCVLIKRYVPELLGKALQAIGWEPCCPPWEQEHDALLLLRRVSA